MNKLMVFELSVLVNIEDESHLKQAIRDTREFLNEELPSQLGGLAAAKIITPLRSKFLRARNVRTKKSK